MTSSWGLTETAPATLLQHEPIDRSGVVGVPLNGVTMKLIPDADMRCEIRVKGPNIMPGYFEDPEKTAAAFDDEGYFITGDAMVFVDPEDPNKGLKFDGRISEDFKLLTGTWVRAAQLRIDMLACLAPLAVDLVITGADRYQIGVMIFPDRAELEREGFDLTDDDGAIRCRFLHGESPSPPRRTRPGNTGQFHSDFARHRAQRARLDARGRDDRKGQPQLSQGADAPQGPAGEALYDDADPAVVTI